jgi:hypothetical protein
VYAFVQVPKAFVIITDTTANRKGGNGKQRHPRKMRTRAQMTLTAVAPFSPDIRAQLIMLCTRGVITTRSKFVIITTTNS